MAQLKIDRSVNPDAKPADEAPYDPLRECLTSFRGLIIDNIPDDVRTPKLSALIWTSSGSASLDIDAAEFGNLVKEIPYTLGKERAVGNLLRAQLLVAKGHDNLALNALCSAQLEQPDALLHISEQDWIDVTKKYIEFRKSDLKFEQAIAAALKEMRDRGTGEAIVEWRGESNYSMNGAKNYCVAEIALKFSLEEGKIKLEPLLYVPIGDGRQIFGEPASFSFNCTTDILPYLLDALKHIRSTGFEGLNNGSQHPLTKAQHGVSDLIDLLSKATKSEAA